MADKQKDWRIPDENGEVNIPEGMSYNEAMRQLEELHSDGVQLAVQEGEEIPEHLLEDASNDPQIDAGQYTPTPEQWADRTFLDDDMAEEVTSDEVKWYNPLTWNYKYLNPVNWFSSDDEKAEAKETETQSSWSLKWLNPVNWFSSDDEKAETKEQKPYQKMSAYRYRMPSFLGGASEEEKQAYEIEMARTYTGEKMRNLSWWERRPRILGGEGYLQAAIYQGRKAMEHLPDDIKEGETVYNPLSEIVKGVTMEDLQKAGFDNERVLQIKVNADNALAEKANQAGVERAGLSAHLAQNGQSLTLNQEELGVTREEMKTIIQLSQRDK